MNRNYDQGATTRVIRAYTLAIKKSLCFDIMILYMYENDPPSADSKYKRNEGEPSSNNSKYKRKDGDTSPDNSKCQ